MIQELVGEIQNDAIISREAELEKGFGCVLKRVVETIDRLVIA